MIDFAQIKKEKEARTARLRDMKEELDFLETMLALKDAREELYGEEKVIMSHTINVVETIAKHFKWDEKQYGEVLQLFGMSETNEPIKEDNGTTGTE